MLETVADFGAIDSKIISAERTFGTPALLDDADLVDRFMIL